MNNNSNQKNSVKLLDNPVKWILIIVLCFSFWWVFFIPAIVGAVYLWRFCGELKELNIEKEFIKRNVERFNEPRYCALKSDIENAEKKLLSESEKIGKVVYTYKAILTYINQFRDDAASAVEIQKIQKYIDEIGIDHLLDPTVELKLRSTDMKDLKKQSKVVAKDIDSLFMDYEKRYTSKANLALYRIMVIALRAELQNVLYTMKFGKLEDSEAKIIEITNKYLKIVADGNQSIAPTVTKFIVQAKSLFLDQVKIEYEYYLRKERMKEEQKALREQMRQEAEEQKRLEQEKKKIEAEESKYVNEMEKLQKQLADADSQKSEVLTARIAELEEMLSKVNEKKENIVKLQNGKAGCVYIISNLGSFGDHVFKIGMTRRFEPQTRIDELGDASVPFSFDVHSFIFSDDAAKLETEIHHRLNERRVNKINLRKEFFDIGIDELESLVYELDPTADFNKTMIAEQYRQSLSINDPFTETSDEEYSFDEE